MQHPHLRGKLSHPAHINYPDPRNFYFFLESFNNIYLNYSDNIYLNYSGLYIVSKVIKTNWFRKVLGLWRVKLVPWTVMIGDGMAEITNHELIWSGVVIQGALSSNHERGRLDQVNSFLIGSRHKEIWHLGFSVSLFLWGCILLLSWRQVPSQYLMSVERGIQGWGE